MYCCVIFHFFHLVSTSFCTSLVIRLNKRQIQNCRGNWGIGSGKYQTLLQAALPTLASGEHMPLKIQGLITCSHSNWLHVNETDFESWTMSCKRSNKNHPDRPMHRHVYWRSSTWSKICFYSNGSKIQLLTTDNSTASMFSSSCASSGSKKRSSARVVWPWSTQANRKIALRPAVAHPHAVFFLVPLGALGISWMGEPWRSGRNGNWLV